MASKLTREEAAKIAELSGTDLVNINSLKEQMGGAESIITGEERQPLKTDTFYHMNCEYDPLRTEDNLSSSSMSFSLSGDDTHQIEINNAIVKSTFIGYNPTGRVERLSYKDLPPELVKAAQQAPQLQQRQQNQYVQPVNRKKLIPK